MGQSFVACENGNITSILVGFSAQPKTAGTVELYLDEDPGSGTLLTETPVASWIQATDFTSNTRITFNLSTLFPALDNGTLYRFAVKNTTGGFVRVRGTAANDYPDGTLIFPSGNPISNADMDFEVNMSSSIAPQNNVPTLSQWGLIILALLFMTSGTLYLLQSHFEEQKG